MLRRETFMVCREGQLKEREAREEPAAFTEECLRRIGNRHVRSLRVMERVGCVVTAATRTAELREQA